MWQFLVFFLVIVTIPSNGEFSNCKIKINSGDKYEKVFSQYHWTLPVHNFGSAESIKHGSLIQFKCQAGFQREDLVENSYKFQCVNGLFNRTFSIEDILCQSTYHKNTQTFQISPIQFGSKIFKCDQNEWKSIQVKTKQSDGKSKHLYTVCLDSTNIRTKFVYQPPRKDNLTKVNSTRRDVWGLNHFGHSTFQKVQLTVGYVQAVQKKVITNAFPERYNSTHMYPYTFNRGHLAPYADFNEIVDKKASCLYINVAPQWSSFNSNSWAAIEKEVRNIIKTKPSEWEVYTGTYGSIPTSNGSLFVSPYVNKDDKFVRSYVPVPKLYWKILYNISDKNKSKVYVGINNPELKSPAEFINDYVICKPIPDKKGEIFHGNEFRGFFYECNLPDILEKLKKEEKIVK